MKLNLRGHALLKKGHDLNGLKIASRSAVSNTTTCLTTSRTVKAYNV